MSPTAEDRRVTIQTSDGKILWQSNPGPQTEVLYRAEDEILFGGRRGGGKSQAGIVWLLLGNMRLDPSEPMRWTYINNPNYAALVLRRNATDLSEWVEEAKKIYEPLGADFSGKPTLIKWKSGARIYTNHLEDEGAFEKYKGWNIWKVLVEELTLVPKRDQYVKIFGSMRAFNADGKVVPQVFATTNPDGIGSGWVCSRFVEVLNKKGKYIEWGRTMTDPITKRTRVFIESKLSDNPYAASNPSYMGMLLEQNKQTQDAWIHGLWHSQSGAFFTELRDQLLVGPREGEPVHANHFIRPVELKPWWYRWGGGDWGYKHYAALYKFCKNQSDQRIHVYDEMVVNQVGSFELGTRIANWWAPDLERLPDRHITLHFSPDAFAEDDSSNTKAQQVQAGIVSILGPKSSFIEKRNADEDMVNQRDPDMAARMFDRRRADEMGPLCISLKKANHNRPMGASFIRDLLRWWAANVDTEADLGQARHIYETRGELAYLNYMQQFQDRPKEVLPKIQIWLPNEGGRGGCPHLRRCLPQLQHDPKRPEDVMKFDADGTQQGDDPYDGFRYGVMAWKEIEKIIPRSYFVSEQTDHFAAGVEDINIRIQIARTQAAIYDNKYGRQGGGMALPRAGASLHRLRPN